MAATEHGELVRHAGGAARVAAGRALLECQLARVGVDEVGERAVARAHAYLHELLAAQAVHDLGEQEVAELHAALEQRLLGQVGTERRHVLAVADRHTIRSQQQQQQHQKRNTFIN